MILAIKTDSMSAEIFLLDKKGTEMSRDVWEAGRGLAKDLLKHIDTLVLGSGSWAEVEGLIVFRGPGSFTGLRIGITTANTISYANNIPIVGEIGSSWIEKGFGRLRNGITDKIVLPEYGSDPHITAPKK